MAAAPPAAPPTTSPNTERAVVPHVRFELTVQNQAECINKVQELTSGCLERLQCANKYHCVRLVGNPRSYTKKGLTNGRPPVLPNGHRTIGKGETIWCVCNGLFVPAAASETGRPRRAVAQQHAAAAPKYESAEGGGCFVCEDCRATGAWMDSRAKCRPCELEKLELPEDVRAVAESQRPEREWIVGSLMKHRDAMLESDKLLNEGKQLAAVESVDDDDAERPSAPPTGDSRRKELIASKKTDRVAFEEAHNEWLRCSNAVSSAEKSCTDLQRQLQERAGGAASAHTAHLEELLQKTKARWELARTHMTRARSNFESAAERCYNAERLDADGPDAFGRLSPAEKEKVFEEYKKRDLERARGAAGANDPPPSAPRPTGAGAGAGSASSAGSSSGARRDRNRAPPATTREFVRPKHVKTSNAALQKARKEWRERRERAIDKHRRSRLGQVRADRAKLNVEHVTLAFQYEVYHEAVGKLIAEDLGPEHAAIIQAAAAKAVKKALKKKREAPAWEKDVEYASDAEDRDFDNERWDDDADPEPMLETEYVKQLEVEEEAGAQDAAEQLAAEGGGC